jgi:S1-C subfamily serine protease
MRQVQRLVVSFAVLLLVLIEMTPARAVPAQTLESVVSVLPVWPGNRQGGTGTAAGVAPEGSGIVLRSGGVIATAWHVVEQAERIDVRLSDGRILPAKLLAHDVASDIAILRVEADLPSFEIASEVVLAQPVCAIGNAYGMGLSLGCGVISATLVTDAGFNPVEDYVQTDAAVHPGVSGGALVDVEGFAGARERGVAG